MSVPPTAAPAAARTRVGTSRRSLLLLVPAVVFIGVLFIYPLLGVAARSITDPQFGLDNYVEVFTSPRTVDAIIRTIVMAFIVMVSCVLIGFPYTYLMSTVGPIARLVLTAAVLAPFWTSVMIRTYAWYILLQDSGPISATLGALGIEGVSLLRQPVGVTIAMAQVLLPFMILPLYATLRKIDLRLVKAAMGLGSRPSTAFVTVYLPLAVPGIVAGGTLVFVLTLGFYLLPVLLGSPKTAMLSQLIYNETSRLNWGLGTAMAVVLLVVAGAIVAVGQWGGKRLSGWAE